MADHVDLILALTPFETLISGNVAAGHARRVYNRSREHLKISIRTLILRKEEACHVLQEEVHACNLARGLDAPDVGGAVAASR